MVIQVDSANGPPIFSMIPFQETRMMTGTSKTRITDLLLRHCVLKSALNRQDNAVEVDGIIVSIFIDFMPEQFGR